jgi:very-short-patch-repair endonuclease
MAKITWQTAIRCTILLSETDWPLFVDFYAPKAKLLIEIDGSQHLEAPQIAKDRERDEYLGGLGLMVLRVDSRQALKDTEAVMEYIYQAITKRLTE